MKQQITQQSPFVNLFLTKSFPNSCLPWTMSLVITKLQLKSKLCFKNLSFGFKMLSKNFRSEPFVNRFKSTLWDIFLCESRNIQCTGIKAFCASFNRGRRCEKYRLTLWFAIPFCCFELTADQALIRSPELKVIQICTVYEKISSLKHFLCLMPTKFAFFKIFIERFLFSQAKFFILICVYLFQGSQK